MSIHAKIVDTPARLKACLSLRKSIFVDEQGVPVELEVDEFDQLDAATHVQLINENDGQTIGTARIKPYDGTTAKVQRVAVVQSRRSTGCGRLLMEYAEKVARCQGFQCVILDAQLSAEGFYRRLGYRRVNDQVFLDAGIEHVRMKKTLTQEDLRHEI